MPHSRNSIDLISAFNVYVLQHSITHRMYLIYIGEWKQNRFLKKSQMQRGKIKNSIKIEDFESLGMSQFLELNRLSVKNEERRERDLIAAVH